MRGRQVYLAGPISGCTYGECTDWRDLYVDQLKRCNIECWSPMRNKAYLKKVGVIDGSYDFDPLATPRGIMTRDFDDCTKCDLLLVNFKDATKPSIGTIMEVAWAFQTRTPVVAVMPEGNVHEHPMISEAIGFRVDSHEVAMELIVSILGDE